MFCIRKKGVSSLLSNIDLHGCHDLRNMTWFCCYDNAVPRCNKKGKPTVRKLSTWLLYTGADIQEQEVASDLVVSFVILPEREHQPPCWMGGWQWQQSSWSQVLRKDLYFCWSLHTHWCDSSKYPWCGNMTSHYKQNSGGEFKYAGKSEWWHVPKGQNDSLVAVGEVKQVLHCHKGVAESFHRGNSLFCINQQHLLQQAHKLSAICLLSH